jgi:hypothetical protein
MLSRDALQKHTEYLASQELRGREFGSNEDRLAAAYVRKHFKEYNLIAPQKYPDYLQQLPYGGQNVLGILQGSDLGLSDESVIVDAHQDHMGDGFAGASDNAAGMAIMLEVARALAENRESVRRSVVFACFDGEEAILNVDGKRQLMQGATFYTHNPVFDLKKTSAMLALDTLGRNALSSDLLFILGLERSLLLQMMIEHVNIRTIKFGTDLLTGVMGNYLPFVEKRVPSLFISNGMHRDYHGKGDTADKISYDLLLEDSKFLMELIEKIANHDDKADFCKNPLVPEGENENVLSLLTLLRDDIGKIEPNDAGRFDPIIERLKGSPSRKDLKQAVQIWLGFVTPNFAKLYLFLNEAQLAERKKDYAEALDNYSKILELYEEYRVPYLWMQEIREKILKLESKV